VSSNQKQPQAPTNITSPQELSTAATTIAEELAKSDQKKNNVIVYNLAECSNPTTEKDNFIKLCKEATDLDVRVQKCFRLGQKIDGEVRPLLIRLESEDHKLTLLSRTPKLRFHKQYKNVYVNAPDMTKFQRNKHKRLIDKLKVRKQQGPEENLIIRNGVIMKRQPRMQTIPQLILQKSSSLLLWI